VDESARLDVFKPLELLIAATRNRAIYDAHDLEPGVAAARDAFDVAVVSPSL
jgi:hypothetical protein